MVEKISPPKKILNGLLRTRYQGIKIKIREGLLTAFETGRALIEVRDEELYVEEYKSFEEFCKKEYDLVRQHAYRLMEAYQTRKALPEKCHQLVTSESQARELAKVPEAEREAVLTLASKNGPPTAAKIKKAAGPAKKPANTKAEKPEAVPCDKVVTKIPAKMLSEWQRADRVSGELLRDLSSIIGIIKFAQEDKDQNWSEVNFSDTIAHLQQVYSNIKLVKPYAECPCNGLGKCTLCSGRGWVSEFRWDHVVPEETRKLREKAKK